MFKFIHTADLHLDSPLSSLALRDPELAERVGNASRQALARIVDAALEHHVDALLIAGDLFDGDVQSMKTAGFLAHQMERLNTGGVRVFLIRGNHDAESVLTREIAFPPNVHVFTGRGECIELDGVAIHGVSFAQKHAPDSLLPKYKAPIPGAFNIGMLHTSLAGAEGHDVYAPCSLADLTGHGYDYWALGHVHGRRIHHESPHVVMPGMPQGRDIGESGAKSATLVQITDGTVTCETIPTASVIFDRVTCDLSGLETWRDARQSILRDLETLADRNGAFTISRVHVIGAGDMAWRLRRDRDQLHAELSEDAAAHGRLAIEKIDVALDAPPQDDQSARAELVSLMDDVAQSPGFREQARQIFDDLVSDLPPDIRDAFGDSEATRAALLDTLAQDGVADVAARLMGQREEDA